MRSKRLLRIVASPFILAAFLTAAVFAFIWSSFPRYHAKVTAREFLSRENSRVLWIDTNYDGESEKLEWFSNSEGKATYKITGSEGLIRDLRLFDGEALTALNPPLLSDLDANHFPEVFAFYHRHDSLFFQTVCYKPDTILQNGIEIFVAMVSNDSGGKDYIITGPVCGDLDNDQYNELIFCVMAGYPILPRNIFSWNFHKNKLLQSPFTGAVSRAVHLLDLDGDDLKEILVGQYAPANMHSKDIDGINDQEVRLFVLNDRLHPKFKPPVFGSGYSSLEVIPVQHDGKYLLAVLTSNASIPEENFTLMLFSQKGEMLSRTHVKPGAPAAWFVNLHQPETISILDFEGRLHLFDLDLRPISTARLPYKKTNPVEMDVDDDGKPEYLAFSPIDQTLIIARSGLKNHLKVKLPDISKPVTGIRLRKNKNQPDEIMVDFRTEFCLISYQTSPWFWTRFPLLGIIYALFCGLVFLIQNLQRMVLKEKYMAERKVSELKLLLLRKQLSPHFLFNAINAISYRLIEKNPEEANHNIVRLSRLIRNNLVSVNSFSRPLYEEVEAVKAYAEIISAQREDPFTFDINIAAGTDMEIQVPVLVIQNYIENAIHHGIGKLGSFGKVILVIHQDQHFLHIVISDNGIGREQAQHQKSSSTGKGIELMQQFFNEINKYNTNKISAFIEDLRHDDGSPAGTSVLINIPVDLKYHLYEK